MSLARTALSVLATQVVSAPIALVTQVILARLLTVEGRGLYAVGTEFVILSVAVVQIGWPTAAIYRIRNRGTAPSVVATETLWVGILMSAAAVGVALLLRDSIAERFLRGAPVELLAIAVATIPFQLLGQFFTGIARALDRFDVNNAHLLATVAIPLLGMPLALTLFGATAENALWVFLLTQASAATGVILWVGRLSGFARGLDRRELSETLSYGGRVSIHNILSSLHERMDVLLLAWLSAGVGDVAIYAIAVAVVNRIRLVPAAIALSLFPTVAQLDSREAGALTSRVLAHSMLWVIVSVLVLAPLSFWLVPVLFGERYRASVTPLLILLPGTAFLTIHMILTRFFASRDLQRVSIACQALGTLLNLTMNWILIPRLGAVGAAWASLVSYSSQGLAILWAFRLHSGQPLARSLILQRGEFAVYRRWLGKLRRLDLS